MKFYPTPMLHSEILPQTSKNLHRLICHICDISQLCNTPSQCRTRRTTKFPATWTATGYIFCIYCTLYIVYLSKDGYDKAYRDVAADYYGEYTSNETASDESESSDSDESESSDSNSDKDKDSDSDKYKYKYACKYKYKYACKSSDKPSDEPKDKPKDDKQTDQKYSVNCTTVSTVRQCPLYDTDDESEDERLICNLDPGQRYIWH